MANRKCNTEEERRERHRVATWLHSARKRGLKVSEADVPPRKAKLTPEDRAEGKRLSKKRYVARNSEKVREYNVSYLRRRSAEAKASKTPKDTNGWARLSRPAKPKRADGETSEAHLVRLHRWRETDRAYMAEYRAHRRRLRGGTPRRPIYVVTATSVEVIPPQFEDGTSEWRQAMADRRRVARQVAKRLGLQGPPRLLGPKCKNKDEKRERRRVQSNDCYQRKRRRLAAEGKVWREKRTRAETEGERLNRSRERARESAKRNIARARAYSKSRYTKDVEYRLVCILRAALYGALKRAKVGRKTDSTLSLLGCTVGEFRSHIEGLFQTGMSWSNMGKWELDHKRPIASFDLTDPDQQRICFSKENLQPLWKQDNRDKRARLDWTPPLKKAA